MRAWPAGRPARRCRALPHRARAGTGGTELLRSCAPATSESRSRARRVLARKLQDYPRWRNANARHPDVLAAQRRERARIRSERQQRWGRPKIKAA
jgi:hypothetical protein